MKQHFKLILPAEYYRHDSISGGYTDMSLTNAGMDYLYNSDDVGLKLKVVGIVRPGEDSSAMVDLNCVMSEDGLLIELQGTGEERPFTVEEQQELVRLCEKGIRQLQQIQKEILG